MLFAFAGNERQQQHGADDEHGRDEEHRRLKAGRQVGQDGVDPEEGEVGLGRGLDDGGIGLAGGAEGAEEEGAGHDGEHDGRGEDGVLPGGIGDEGNAGLLGEFVVLAARRWLLLTMRPGMGHSLMPRRSTITDAGRRSSEQNAGNDEDVQREEAGERWPGDDGAAEQQMHQRRRR